MPTENVCSEAYLFMSELLMDQCDAKATAHKHSVSHAPLWEGTNESSPEYTRHQK